jgi:hypothetical protein
MPDGRLIPVVNKEAGCSAHDRSDNQLHGVGFPKGVSCRNTTYRAAPLLSFIVRQMGLGVVVWLGREGH